MNKESLENVKVGDKLFYEGAYQRIFTVTVERITKTQIIIKDGGRFRIKDGFRIGSDAFSHSMIRPLTASRVERVAIVELKAKAIFLRGNLAIPQGRRNLEKLIAALKPFVDGGKQ